MANDHQYYSNFIWQVADLLRGPYRPPQYERVMLPLTVLRRFDCVLASTKQKVLREYDRLKDGKLKGEALDSVLNKVAGQRFHNHSPLDFEKLKGDPDQIDKHLIAYINGFSANVRLIFDYFEFTNEIEKMREANILYLVVTKFSDIDLHISTVSNIQMGTIFEDLIRRFNEAANETAGDHFTPRQVIKLMVDILFAPDDAILRIPGTVRKLLDVACGTGGMLSESQNHLHDMHAEAQLWVFGQDFNPRSYAVAASDLLMKGNDNSEIRFGDSLIDDQFGPNDQITQGKFDYFLANPPFGVDWKKQQKEIQREHDKLGFSGRFGAGLPRINDGALLFLQHMISKFVPYRPEEKLYGSRLGIVFNGSPLFTGGAGSGESEIRKWIIENDWLDAIIALPEQMFYNTGIGTYIWFVTNRKEAQRKGKIQLIDARKRWKPMRRSLGDKRRDLGDDDIANIVREYGDFTQTTTCKIFDNADFGYNRVTVERPLRLRYQMDAERKGRFLDAVPHLLDDVQAIDSILGREPRSNWNDVRNAMLDLLKLRGSRWKALEQKLFRDVFADRDPEAEPVILKARKVTGENNARVWGWFRAQNRHIEQMYEADASLRDFENVELKLELSDYFRAEVEPHVPDSWMDGETIRRAYEINLNRHFYTYIPPRPLAQIDSELQQIEKEIQHLLSEVTK
jgi:type I restriction enzyme M protein